MKNFNIEDMATTLSNKCRFGGFIEDFYSVAEHSVHVYDVLKKDYPNDPFLLLAGLLHEVDEYVSTIDFPSPIKHSFFLAFNDTETYSLIEFENMCKRILCKALNLKLPFADPRIKKVDLAMCGLESKKLRGIELKGYGDVKGVKIRRLPPKKARTLFLETFRRALHDVQALVGQTPRTKKLCKNPG